MPKKPLDFVLYGVFALAILKLGSLYFSVNPDDSNWNEFKIEHHCKLRKTEYGVERASWNCDDGKTYFRWMQQR
ncbi:MAG: hypothetical protein HOO93_11215 [Methyloglobulus sp.]|nr:hypothetical protein [Methyloglobulus sp.]